jgi:arylsulfatase A-like enzyme
MLRAGRYKYVYHTPPDRDHPAERELYDLAVDPGEFTNLAAEAEHARRIARMHTALVTELGADPDEAELRCRADYRQGYGRPERPIRPTKGR